MGRLELQSCFVCGPALRTAAFTGTPAASQGCTCAASPLLLPTAVQWLPGKGCSIPGIPQCSHPLLYLPKSGCRSDCLQEAFQELQRKNKTKQMRKGKDKS